MNNSERFISAFNKIEKYLDDVIKAGDRFTSFSSSVKRAAEKNIIVRRYKDDLLEISELRNAIVHERTDPEYLIAEPHDSVIELLELVRMYRILLRLMTKHSICNLNDRFA